MHESRAPKPWASSDVIFRLMATSRTDGVGSGCGQSGSRTKRNIFWVLVAPARPLSALFLKEKIILCGEPVF